MKNTILTSKYTHKIEVGQLLKINYHLTNTSNDSL